jgi:hypothetical protein
LKPTRRAHCSPDACSDRQIPADSGKMEAPETKKRAREEGGKDGKLSSEVARKIVDSACDEALEVLKSTSTKGVTKTLKQAIKDDLVELVGLPWPLHHAA